jgi:uncharacterized protein YjbK
MSRWRERELKLRLLEQEGYASLIRAGGPGVGGRPERQSNHYFDTGDLFLVQHGAMLRLRRARGLVLTFKLGGETADARGYFDALEVNADLPPEVLEAALKRPALVAEHPSPPAVELRQRFGRLDLVYHGCLENERVKLHHLPYPVEVDRLTFPDGSESHELEIETGDPEGARRWIEGELRARHIAFRPQHRTKLEQFLERRGPGPFGERGRGSLLALPPEE